MKQRTVVPELKRQSEIAHSRGKFIASHIDGENMKLLDKYVDAGVDIADSICPTPMAKTTLKETREVFDGKLTIWGGIPSISMLKDNMDDYALWDICGKALGLPVAKLLGGYQRKNVAMYATGCFYCGEQYLDVQSSLPELEKEAAGYVEQGFQKLKVKVGLLPVKDDAIRVEAIRKSVGPDIDIFVDCNHAYMPNMAVRMGRYLEEQGVLFIEEPVVPENLEGYRFVREKLDLAVAGGESEFTLRT